MFADILANLSGICPDIMFLEINWLSRTLMDSPSLNTAKNGLIKLS